MAKKLALSQTREPGTRAFRVWVDSEFKRFTSVTASAIRNTIHLSDVEPHIKNAEYAYLRFKIDEYNHFLQAMQDDLQESGLLNSTTPIETPVLQNFVKREAVDTKSPQNEDTTEAPALETDNLTISSIMARSVYHVKVDPHMIRAAGIIGKLNPEQKQSETALMRLYFIMRHIDTWREGQNKGQKAWGYVTLKELRHWLKAAGLYTKQSFKRWIDDGVQAGYWTHAKADKRLYYRGLKAVAKMLISAIPDELLPDFMGNQAIGGRMVWVDVRGKLGAFKGQILGAWLEQRARDENGVTAQNQTIADMWGVSVRCVQYWREAANIPHIPNYAETNNPNLPIKRIPNTYFSPEDTREHSHTGQSRKVRKLANSDMTARGFSPDFYLDVGEAKQHRLYFRNGEKRTALEAIEYYRTKYGYPNGLSQYALLQQRTVKTGVIGLHVEVLSCS